jgi:hypothetical protein
MSNTLNDLWYAWLTSQVPAAVQNGTVSATPGGSTNNAVTGRSSVVSAAPIAPGAGATLASIAGLTGIYEVSVQTMFSGSGTPVDADAVNIQYTDGTNTMSLLTNVNKDVPSVVRKFYCQGTAFTVSLKAIAAATASVAYSVNIVATKVGS